MGRQAEFFATPEDIKELVDFFISRGGQIVDEKNGMNIENDVVNYDINTPFIVQYIVLDKSKLVFSKGGVNILDSDAIELKLPRPNGFKRDENRRLIIEPNHYESGRIYYNKYFVADGKWHEFDSGLEKLYNKAYGFIRRNYKRSKDGSCYMGKHAYEKYLKGEYVPIDNLGVVEF